MTKAFIDTTVLTDALLKSGPDGEKARHAIRRYAESLLPVYAIKEFKAGPLKNFVWFHNKLWLTGSFSAALDALHAMSRTPRRYLTSTAIEALREAASSIADRTADTLVQKYGAKANIDSVLCDQFRISIKTAVHKAWKRRRSLTTEVVWPLACYRESSPKEEGGLLSVDPTRCDPTPECSLAPYLKSHANDLSKLREATLTQPESPERKRRSKALRQLIRKPRQPLTDEICRDLGDAVFVMLAPDDATILTTNIRDHKPLARALGKSVSRPEDTPDTDLDPL